LETQAPTNPGDSGGPVVNEQGEIVAVVAGNQPKGVLMHFCIDVSEVRVVLGRAGRLLEPKTAADYNERGWRYHLRGLHNLANDPAYHHNRAIAYENKKNHKRALADYQEALRVGPRFAASHFNRADLCERLGMFKESEQHYRAALGLEPAYGKRLKVFEVRR